MLLAVAMTTDTLINQTTKGVSEMATYGLTIPAIRGTQGSRVFYATNLPNEALRNYFGAVEPAVEKSQRPLDPNHAKKIERYIIENQTEYVLGALTYSANHEGQFTATGTENSGFELGDLTFPPGTIFKSLDGQHRREAVLNASSDSDVIAKDSIAVLIYVEPEVVKRRQMFSDMNSTPKKVSKSLNVTFDSRDPFAMGAKSIITKHPMLIDRIEEFGPRVRADSTDFFTLSSIQDTLKKLFVGSVGRVKDPSMYPETRIVTRGVQFFDILQKARSEYTEATKSHGDLIRLREETILFSSTTLRALAGAVFKAMEYYDVGDLSAIETKLVNAIMSIDFSVNSPLFIDSGFISSGSPTPSARNQEVQAATNAIFKVLQDGTGTLNDRDKKSIRSRG